MNSGQFAPSSPPTSGTSTPISSSRQNSCSAGTAPSTCSTTDSVEPGYDPIAIVGMSCKLPGGVDNPSKFWELLTAARSAHCDVPERAYNARGFNHPNADRPGSLPSNGGYFIEDDVRCFDNAFFGINNLEATYMDPQQRKLLEIIYECLESGGQTLESVNGSKTGCYVGNFTNDWALMQYKDADYASHYSATGSAPSILANRLSYIFGLRGPSLTVDTACSSSAYSLHLACNALHNGECDSAIVASANIIQTPEQTIQATKAGILSDDSTCHTFDASAAGYGRGEAVSALFVKRLSDAVRDGDPVRAIIRATAINANGRTAGISYPGSIGQSDAIKAAYARAKLDVEDTQYVEAHGTGTAVGDPIEVEGLVGALRPSETSSKLLIGSVKTNMGHSEGASAITSIIKVVLALEKGIIPPTIGLQTLNPRLKAFENQMGIVTEITPWPTTSVRRAGVNSFGFGGANGHIILEAPHLSALFHPRQKRPVAGPENVYVVPLSARSNTSLARVSQNLTEFLTKTDVQLADLAYTLGSKRSSLSCRSYALLRNDTMTKGVKRVQLDVRTGSTTSATASPPPLTMVFTGQGAQWLNMGSSLRSNFPVFQSSVEKLDACLSRLENAPPWTIADLLDRTDHEWDINSAAIAQPLCTALQIALVDLLSDWNLLPEQVIGHSSGEIAAAYCAGALTAQEALAVAFYRGLAVSKSQKKGAMAAIGLDRKAVEDLINSEQVNNSVKIACVNSPQSITISGDNDKVESLVRKLSEQSIFARTLRTEGMAYHSHHMECIADDYERLLSSALSDSERSMRQLRATMMSTVLSTAVSAVELTDPAYWRKNLVSPVLFEPTVQKLWEKCPKQSFIEIGPHSVLKMPLQQCFSASVSNTGSTSNRKEVPYTASLVRNKPAVASLLVLAGELFMQGWAMPFDRINGVREANVLCDLPRYPWEYKQLLWKESRLSKEYRHRKYPRHVLLGTRVPGGSNVVWSWQNIIRKRDVPWLEDHSIEENIVYPAASYLVMAAEALRQYLGAEILEGFVTVRNFKISKALMISEDDAGVDVVTDFQRSPLSKTARSKHWFNFETHSISGQTTSVHATGQISVDKHTPRHWTTFKNMTDRSEKSAADAWYARLASQGFALRGKFESIHQVSQLYSPTEESSSVRTDIRRTEEINTEQSPDEGLGHLLLIDSALQTAIFSATGGELGKLTPRLPVAIEKLRFNASLGNLPEGTVLASSRSRGQGVTQHDARILVDSSTTYAELLNIQLVEYVGQKDSVTTSGAQDPALRVSWRPDLDHVRPSNVSALRRYLRDAVPPENDSSRETLTVMARLILELLLHKKPEAEICFIGNSEDGLLTSILDLLQPISSMQRVKSLTLASYDNGLLKGGILEEMSSDNVTAPKLDDIEVETISDDLRFDFILTSDDLTVDQIQQVVSRHGQTPATYYLHLGDSRRSPGITHSIWNELLLEETHRQTIGESSGALQFYRLHKDFGTVETASPVQQPLTYVRGERSTRLDQAILAKLNSNPVYDVTVVPFSSTETTGIVSQSTCIFSAELGRSLLASITSEEFVFLKNMTDNAKAILWLTSNAVMDCSQPDHAAVAGLARALMVEQPSLKFMTLDLGHSDGLGVFERETSENLESILRSIDEPKPELEFAQRNGMLWCSRFVPDHRVNETFRSKYHQQVKLQRFGDIGRCKITCPAPGMVQELFFEEIPGKDLEDGFIEIEIKAAGLNHRDAALAFGNIDSRNCNSVSDFCGIVKAVSSKTASFKIGDRVVAMAPSHLGRYAVVPEWACIKLHEAEPIIAVSSLPKVFSTALYVLSHIAPLSSHQSLLVTSAANPVGQALIQIAQSKGAEVLAIVDSEEEKQLLTRIYDLDKSHVFISNQHYLVEDILKLTEGEGVDIVAAALQNDCLDVAMECCSTFGSFVYIPEGRTDGLGSLDLSQPQRARSFAVANLEDLYFSSRKAHQKHWSDLLRITMRMYREGSIRPIDSITTFDVSEIGQAFQLLVAPGQTGKISITMDQEDALVKHRSSRHKATFSPSKTYVLIGGLGGLGRSVSKWMLDRGAKKLAFLNRSGLDKEPARQLVAELQDAGAEVSVVRGSVDKPDDVQNLVHGIDGPIGGVIHAAMGLYDTMFSTMTCEQWHMALSPKIKGSWNLHHALAGREQELDFFLLMSSNTGSVGTAAESNYSAANAFLDSFARFRRLQGLKAVSVGLGMISEVGYIHENPEVEKILLRKGLYPLNQNEMIQILDIAISEEMSDVSPAPDYHKGHILTGLELIGLQKQREQGFDGNFTPLEDPRFRLLACNFERRMAKIAAGGQGSSSSSSSSPLDSSSSAVNLSSSSSSPAERRAAIMQVIMQKLANLVLVPADSLDEDTMLARFGMDSMLATDFRSQVRKVTGVDIPFVTLLKDDTSIGSLVEIVAGKMN